MTKLFGTSGIRGRINEDITPQLALQVGQALATYKKAKKIVIGQDTRTTSPMLQQALTAGITACGATVLQQGITPTPALAYLTKQLKANAGVMITASHNPPQYNGIKVFNPDTTAYDRRDQRQLEAIITKQQYKLAAWNKIGRLTAINESQQYVNMATKNVEFSKSWRIIIDPGNGSTSHLAPSIFRKLNCRVTSVNSQPDGHFPGRGAEPNEASLSSLCNIVRGLEADLGIAYDGDGDRMVTIDEKGCVTPLDQTFATYAAHMVKRHKNKTIITHVEASMCVEKMVEANGGKVIRTKVGDVNIAKAVKKHRASFGGEPCGAWIHPSYHYCPDGILSSILLIQALEQENETLSKFISRAPKYPLQRKNISCPNFHKTLAMRRIQEALPTAFTNIEEQSDVDGFRLTLKQGWLLVRPSGTEPFIRATVEAETQKAAKGIINRAAKLINRIVKEINQ